MRSPISIVDVDRLDTWTRYRAGLCDTCAANCCTMPLAVQLSDLVRLAGWDVSDLGANTPASSFVAAVKDADNLSAVGLSVFTVAARQTAAETVAALRPVLGSKIPIMIGGGAVTSREDARSLGADDWAADAPGFVELLDIYDGKSRKTG